jgi:wyosine [tRNA(Phe)-imidazoG37] synthetase (radical SAM superfamily)
MVKSIKAPTPPPKEGRQANIGLLCSARIFGPVPSRRLGRSLGVDLVPAKACTYDCIYCESGTTTHLTVERFSPYSVIEIVEELEHQLTRTLSSPEIITLSGAGEPTLYADLGELIHRIKNITSLPVAVLTNGSLLGLKSVHSDLARADVVLPSLDAATSKVFRRINRPHSSLELDQIISGLMDFRRNYSGQIWLEILLVRGINDTVPELTGLKRVIEKLGSDRVQLNTVDRPPAVHWAKPVSGASLSKFADFLGKPAKAISRFCSAAAGETSCGDLAQRIIEMINRRPCTERQISDSLGTEIAEVSALLRSMTKDGEISCKLHQHRYFYTSRT